MEDNPPPIVRKCVYVFVMRVSISCCCAARGGTNGPESYNAGSSVLWHELGHYLGLSHTFPTE